MRTTLSTLLLAGVLLVGVILLEPVASQSCNCAPGLCCSKYGFCGNGEAYCGKDCQGGPCFPPPSPNDVSVPDVVTETFFNGIIAKSPGDCPGRGFFTRATFLKAVENYPLFGRFGSVEDSKREIAAFFAHVTQETGFFCFIEEKDGPSKNYCDNTKTEYPCNPGKGYYGRGPLQLTWNYNYGQAGVSLGFDGLNNPEIVATDQLMSFKAALWYWMEHVHSIVTSGQGFGATINAINGQRECKGADSTAVGNRVAYYTDYCNQFGVSVGDGNLQC